MQLNASYNSILKIAAPIMLFQLVQNIIGFTDTIFLGRVGVVEFNACGISSMFYLVLMMLGYGLSRGGQILIARRAGENEPQKVGLVTDHLIIVEMLMALVIFIILYTSAPYILSLFIQTPEILEAGLIYLDYRSYGIFFSVWAFSLLAFYAGIGKTKIIVYTTCVMAFFNIFLNYGLIFGAFGLPKMGIGGAGLASTIAEGASGLFGLLYLLQDPLRKKFHVFTFKGIRKDLIIRMVNLSAPLVIQFLVGLGGWFVFFTFIENMGENALAVSIVLKWLYQFIGIPAWSIASSINSVASNLVGQQDFENTSLSIKRAILMSIVFTTALASLLFVMPNTLASIFTKDADIINLTVEMLPLLFVISLTCACSSVLFNGIVGVGATTISLIIEIIGVVAYLAYAYTIINVLDGGLTLAWFSEIIYWTILFGFGVVYLKKGSWKKQSL